MNSIERRKKIPVQSGVGEASRSLALSNGSGAIRPIGPAARESRNRFAKVACRIRQESGTVTLPDGRWIRAYFDVYVRLDNGHIIGCLPFRVTDHNGTELDMSDPAIREAVANIAICTHVF